MQKSRGINAQNKIKPKINYYNRIDSITIYRNLNYVVNHVTVQKREKIDVRILDSQLTNEIRYCCSYKFFVFYRNGTAEAVCRL